MEKNPYCKLGEVLDEQARARDVRGPYRVAKHVREATEFKVSGSSVSNYFYGKSHPPPEFNAAFVEAFSLEEIEATRPLVQASRGCAGRRFLLALLQTLRGTDDDPSHVPDVGGGLIYEPLRE